MKNLLNLSPKYENSYRAQLAVHVVVLDWELWVDGSIGVYIAITGALDQDGPGLAGLAR